MTKAKLKSKRVRAKTVKEHVYQVDLGDADTGMAEEKTYIAPPTWQSFHELTQAGLYVMRNTESLVVRIFKVDNGVSITMDVHLLTGHKIHTFVSENSTFQKIKE